MPPVSELTVNQIAAARSGGIASEVRIAMCPNDAVFQCEVSESITNSVFGEFAWDTATIGAYTDVNKGQTILITATTDPAERRNPLFRGRARKVPTADTFFLNESSFNLQAGYIVTVLDTYEILQEDRNGLEFVDFDTPYEDPPPMVKNLQAFYYGEDDTEFQFSFAPVGQAMAEGAAVTGYHWTIPGAVYDVGDDDTQNITVTVPAGHIWAFLDITDDNDVTGRFIFEILVCDRDDDSFMYQAHEGVQINNDIENGLNASVTYFAGVTEILDRTRVAIVAFDHYKNGDNDEFSNVMFVGYLVQEATDITGDDISSTLGQTRFEIQSFGAIAGQIPVPQLAIRNRTTPDAWDEIKLPTTQRIAAYLVCRYSTLGTLCPIDWMFTDDTWFTGDYDLQGQTLLETINRVADEINARLVFFPQGDARMEINANFLSDTDRGALPELVAGGVLPSDLYRYDMPLPYYDTVGQVQAGFASFQTGGGTTVKLDAVAPAVARQEGNETPVIPAQLLESNLSQTNAISAAKQRIADMLAYAQPPEVLNLTYNDAWRFLTCSTQVWVNFDLPATDNTRGIAIDPATRYLLMSLSLSWNAAGTWDISGTARRETVGGLSQVSATISPNIIETNNPVLAILPDNDAYPPDGSLNYDSTDPAEEDLQPFGPYDLGQYQPMTTEDAANSADNAPGATCAVITPVLNFQTGGVARQTPNVTVVSAIYTLYIKGSALIGTDGLTTTYDDGNQPPDFDLPASPGGGTWTSINTEDPTGFIESGLFDPTGPSADTAWIIAFFDLPVTELTSVRLVFDENTQKAGLIQTDAGNTFFTEVPASIGGGLYAIDVAFASHTGSVVALNVRQNPIGDTTTFRLVRMEVTEAGGEVVYGDAFYQFDENGDNAELLSGGKGLNINSTPVAVPPAYDPSHAYVVQLAGNGNVLPFTYFLPSYTGVANQPLYLKICGSGMGS